MSDAAEVLDAFFNSDPSDLPATNESEQGVNDNDHDSNRNNNIIAHQTASAHGNDDEPHENSGNTSDYVLANYSPPLQPLRAAETLFDPLSSSSSNEVKINGSAPSSALDDYFSVPSTSAADRDEQIEPEENISSAPVSLPYLSDDDEAPSSPQTTTARLSFAHVNTTEAPITPTRDDYFPSPINATAPSARRSLSDGENSPYEHVERLSVSNKGGSLPVNSPIIDDFNSHEYPNPLRKNSQDQDTLSHPLVDTSADFLEGNQVFVAAVHTPIHVSQDNLQDQSPESDSQLKRESSKVRPQHSRENSEEYAQRAPSRPAPSRQAPASAAPRRPAPDKKTPTTPTNAAAAAASAATTTAASTSVTTITATAATLPSSDDVIPPTDSTPPTSAIIPPAAAASAEDLRNREESLPPPPPPSDDLDESISTQRSFSIVPPPDDLPPEELPEQSSSGSNTSSAGNNTGSSGSATMSPRKEDEDAQKTPSTTLKSAPPPPPFSADRKGPPPPPPVQVKVSAPTGARPRGREGGLVSNEGDFQRSTSEFLIGVAEAPQRRSSVGSDNGEDPPPPPRVPGPKPPPRKGHGAGDHSTPTRQDLEHARAGGLGSEMSPPKDGPSTPSTPSTPSNLLPRMALDRMWAATNPSMRQLVDYGDEGPSFANSLPHNFEAVSNQVGVGIRQTKSMTVLLKSILDIQRDAATKIMALIEKEQRKQFMDAEETAANELASGAGRLLAAVTRDSIINPRGKDGMERFAKVYDKTIGFLAQEAADQLHTLNQLEKEVVTPLVNHNANNTGRLNALAQTEKACRESMTEVSKQVKKAQENCDKLLEQAIQARIKDPSGSLTSSPQPDRNRAPSSLRSKVNQVSQKISTGQLQKAQKMALQAAEVYEQTVNEANTRQKQFHSQDLPSLFSQLEALERTRLNEVSKILVKLMENKAAANEPRVQSCSRLLLDSKDLDARKDMMDFLQKWIVLSGAPPPPVPFSYQCQCTPNDIARGRFENTSSYFRDTLANVLIKQQPAFPDEKVPHLVEVCIKALADNGGFQSEGIFRISIPKEELEALMRQIDGGDLNVFANNSNPHAPAALLKQWLRLLDEPVIPPEKYAQAVHLGSENSKGDDPEVMAQFFKELPQANQDLLRRITHGLVEEIIKPENVEKNRMSVRNLAIVFSPGFLRNSSDDPMEMLNSQRFEQSFTTKLFECLLHEKHS